MEERRKDEEEADAISAAELPCSQIKHPKSAGNAESCREVVTHLSSLLV